MQYRSDGAILISVREICDAALATGDLDLRAGHRSLSRMEQGRNIHQRLQKMLGEKDRAEVTVASEVAFGNRVYAIRGRADAILDGDPPIVEEIKSVSARGFSEPNDYHTAQANLTAWLYLRQNKLTSVRVRRTLCRVDNEKIKRFETLFTEAELETFCFGLLSRLGYRPAVVEDRYQNRIASVATGRFPYQL